MYLNTLQPAPGSKKQARRLGRGIGSGLGKTCGKGHKGQKSRSGGYHKVGFEGGQMPIQRRLPKFGFSSRKSLFRAEIRLTDLQNMTDTLVDIKALRKANLINPLVKYIKVIYSGEIKRSVTLKGVPATKGAIEAIKLAGGQVVE